MVNHQSRIVDMKLPLPYVISGVIAITGFMIVVGWNASASQSKLDQLIVANTKLEKRLDDRDIRLDSFRDLMAKMQSSTDMNTLRITALESRAK